MASEAALVPIAQRVAGIFDAPFVLDGRETYVSASIGIAVADSEADPDVVLGHADAAMYRAKSNGGRRYELFNAEMTERARERLQMESGLRRALDRGELRLVYQPMVELSGGTLIGVEALLRWQLPGGGTASPGQFLRVAEESGLIVAVGAWVIESACRQAAEWRARWGGQAPRVWVTLSQREVLQPDLAETVQQTLWRERAEASWLGVEISESALIADAEASGRAVGRLRQLGLGLAIDDFGIGYSSLAWLRRCSADVLKIHGSLAGSRADAPLVAAIVSMAGSLGMEVLAKGVETREVLSQVRSLAVYSPRATSSAGPTYPTVSRRASLPEVCTRP